MYLTPNYERFTVPCYIDGQSSSVFVRKASAWELRKAAETELLKYTSKIDQQSLYNEAQEAFQALNQYCADRFDDESRQSLKEPTILDAAWFAYTDLLWNIDYRCWADSGLVDILLGNKAILDVYDGLDLVHSWSSVPLPERYVFLEESLLSDEKHRISKTRMPLFYEERRERNWLHPTRA